MRVRGFFRGALMLCLLAWVAATSLARQREPTDAYAARRARLRAQVDGPVVLFAFTGREDASPSYVFNQEENFYYLTGHNEPGAALLLLPEPPAGKTFDGPREILFLPARNLSRERWDGPRIGPEDANVQQATGFAAVLPSDRLRGELERAAKVFSNFHTLLPGRNEAGYPHRQNWLKWLEENVPGVRFHNVMPALAAMRQVKTPTELKLLERAIEVSVDAHLAAMRMMRPGLYEYQVAARMEYVHKAAGCEREGYAPIVGAGFNSTVLHYNALSALIQPGDVVVLDVGAQCDGYVADITRTLPASGKFTPRQREVYEIVLGAQNAVLAALRPGMTLGGTDEKSLNRIAREYMDRFKDKDGQPMSRHFIHGLGHHVGLNVHDASVPGPLQPGMVLTIEPGLYIPEEKLGVRIEDIVLVTPDGYKLLTARLPRAVAEMEKLLGRPRRAAAARPPDPVTGRLPHAGR